jgi:DNA-binding transcriptional LysR family regulator
MDLLNRIHSPNDCPPTGAQSGCIQYTTDSCIIRGLVMRLKKFDLNLLVVLDTLLSERSATRAGRIVNLSQPAVSNALTRLNRYSIMRRRLARHFSKTYDLKLLPLPIDFPRRTIAMQWNRYRGDDAGIVWLRKMLIASANDSSW